MSTQPTALSAPGTRTPRGATALLALVVLDLTFLVNALDRQVLPVLLPDIRTEYQLSAGQSGLLSTVFTLGLGFAGLASGFLTDRFRRKTVIAVGIAVFSVATLLQPLSTGFTTLVTYRILSGVGEGIQYAALFAAVGSFFVRRKGFALGSINVAYGVGAFLSPVVGTALADGFGSWHAPFFLYAGLGALLLVVMLVVVPRWFTEVRTEPAAAIAVRTKLPVNRNLLACAVLAFVPGFCGYSYLGLYPTYLRTELHFGTGELGVVTGIFAVGSLLSMVSGPLADRYNPRWLLVASVVGSMVAGALMFNLHSGPVVQALLSVVEGISLSGFLLLVTSMLIQRSVPVSAVGRATGIFTLSVYLPAAVSGYVFASLVQRLGWGTAALIQLTALPVVALIAIAVLDHRVLQPRKDLP
ncbi:MFS transporter [Amycolatopsis sacchari]|uniref:Sugar phosphate permease n=1 Tax=Amycolatopsis sacchari TaxID=115433 RepID=A0A1I3Y6A4_9PSEU|nr:MFS transporter [Amycolatopsis sacchari]SFK27302.1 Sugar phosphate permease [Amycolatopsis sacchari]